MAFNFKFGTKKSENSIPKNNFFYGIIDDSNTLKESPQMLVAYKELFDWWLGNVELPLTISEILNEVEIDLSECALVGGLTYIEKTDDDVKRLGWQIKTLEDIEKFRKQPRYGNLGFVFQSLDTNRYEIQVNGTSSNIKISSIGELGSEILSVYSIDAGMDLNASERIKKLLVLLGR